MCQRLARKLRGAVRYVVLIASVSASNTVLANESADSVAMDTVGVKIYFPINKTNYYPGYMGNAERLKAAFDSIASLSGDSALSAINAVTVRGWASPEGPRQFNLWLGRHRAEKLVEMLRETLPQSVDIAVGETGINNHDNVPYPERRYATTDIVFWRNWRPVPKERIAQEIVSPEIEPIATDLEIAISEPQPNPIPEPEPIIETERWPWAALRTNLLTPFMSIGAEVCIGNRWTAAADWNYPWIWRNSKHKNCFELSFLTWELRYWLGSKHAKGDDNRQHRMLGHSVGAYGAWGYYDFQHNWHGHQGHFWSGGVDYLWAKSAFKGAVHFEFEIGVGVIYSPSQPYNVYEDGGLLIREAGRKKKTTYFGPTKAAINLAVPLYRTKKLIRNNFK